MDIGNRNQTVSFTYTNTLFWVGYSSRIFSAIKNKISNVHHVITIYVCMWEGMV